MAFPILITGVGKRIGHALAEHFLRRDLPVIGTYRTAYPALEELRALGAQLHHCDFHNEASLHQFLAHFQEHQPIRAVIHNASDWSAEDFNTGTLADYSALFDRMFQVHTKAPYLINMALRESLSAHPGSRADIIHISDYVTAKGSRKHLAYAASKAALDNLTASFASLLAPSVKVNTIAPALVAFNESDDADYRAKAVRKALFQHEAGYQEMINCVEFLMQSDYITGRTLHLDGGRHLV